MMLSRIPTKTFGDKPDYSNFDRKTWQKRTKLQHQKLCYDYLKCITRKDQKTIEQRYGIRYSCLIELPYFDCSSSAQPPSWNS